MKLSVAMAVYNETDSLAKTLDSVKGWVDEIVVANASTSDKPGKILDRYKAKVVRVENQPVFHVNKQKAIDRCQGDWILQMDADEVVDDQLKKEILEIVKNGSEFSAYWIPRKNFFLGRWLRKSGQYPDPVIRFFKRGKAKLPCQSVHEQMVVDGEVGWLNGHLAHYNNSSFAEYLKRNNRYSSMFAQEMIDRKEKPGLATFLKMLCQGHKDFFIRFVRCKGFLDGFPGFVFAFYSGLTQLTVYVKFWEMKKSGKKKISAELDWE
ncbi:MAG: glycosyltransferase family 2 protein [Patescibacteria group bacterium]